MNSLQHLLCVGWAGPLTSALYSNAFPLVHAAQYSQCNTAYLQVSGKDVNLGRHVSEDDAAKAYDKAAICARGKDVAKLNFPVGDYSEELEQLQNTTVAKLAPLLRSPFLSLLLPNPICLALICSYSGSGMLLKDHHCFT